MLDPALVCVFVCVCVSVSRYGRSVCFLLWRCVCLLVYTRFGGFLAVLVLWNEWIRTGGEMDGCGKDG